MRLAVTLVTGRREPEKDTVCAALGALGTPGGHDATADVDFALSLAERLVADADDGARGSAVVRVPAEADPVELALVVPRVFAERSRDVAVRNIVAVATAGDLRALLFRDGGDDGRTADIGEAEQLALQLEFATVVVVAGAHSLDAARRLEIVGLLSKITPCARQFDLLPDGELLYREGTGRPAAVHDLGSTAGWMLELAGPPLPTESHGIGCLVYRDPRPFHPTRLATAVDGWLEPADAGLIVRSRGLVRLATRAGRVGSWSTAGEVLALDPTAMTSWDTDTPPGQELVFFGRGLNRDHIVAVLDSCLLSDDELVAGPMEWETYVDPFPAWDLEHGH